MLNANEYLTVALFGTALARDLYQAARYAPSVSVTKPTDRPAVPLVAHDHGGLP